MRKLAISLVCCSALTLAACSTEKPAEESGDAAAAVATAEDAKAKAEKRSDLENRMKQAAGDLALLKSVWEDANAAGEDDIKDAANKAVETLILPKAEAAKRSNEILALKKQVAIGSPAFKKLNERDGELLAKEAAERAAKGM